MRPKSQETRSEKDQLLAQVFGLQGQTKGVDEGKRQEVANHISDIYLATKQEVEKILADLDGKVSEKFDKGAEEAKRAFEGYVDQRMSKYKWDRYLSNPLIGLGQWVADQFMGLPPEVNVFYAEGRQVYLASMDRLLNGHRHLYRRRAESRQAARGAGKQEIQTYTAGLSPELQQVGREAADKIQGKFNELDESVDSKQSELVDSLAQRYVEKSQELDSRIEEMKQANSGLVNMAAQAIGGVIKTIQDLATMLGNVLQRAANAVSAILKDPIKFLSNLIEGVKQGLQRFVSNIGTHLQTGLIGWLTGALGSVITAFPKSFSDLRGILNMVLEIFGLTYARIRQNVVKGLGERGEEVFGALEKAWEIFQIIRTEGLGGLWEFIKDMVGDLKAMVIDQIQTMIAQEVIQAGIQWVVGLLGGPAGAFIKAAQAIIKIVMWFVRQWQQAAGAGQFRHRLHRGDCRGQCECSRAVHRELVGQGDTPAHRLPGRLARPRRHRQEGPEHHRQDPRADRQGHSVGGQESRGDGEEAAGEVGRWEESKRTERCQPWGSE